MIENDDQLRQACEAMSDMYCVLASYRAKILPVNPRNYAVLAQGPLQEIRKIQSEIDDYVGLHTVSAVKQAAAEPAAALRDAPHDFRQTEP